MIRSFARLLGTLALASHLAAQVAAQPVAGSMAEPAPPPRRGEQMPTLAPIGDGAERYNRGAFAFNHGLITVLIDPLQQVWRTIFPRPVRNRIKKVTYNLAYPNRLVNCMLQNKWGGAGSETGRFLINTTVGVVGIWDPASSWGLANYNEDWGQTFYTWGWQESDYFMMPFLGPKTWREGLAQPFDMAFNPLTYVMGGGVTNINEMTYYIPIYKAIRRSEKDPYAIIRDAYALQRAAVNRDFSIDPAAPADPAPTLGAVFLDVRDKKFLRLAKTGSVRLPTTGRHFKFNYWLQDHEAPLVFINGGSGSFRLSSGTAAYAEMCYNRGFSVVTVSSVFNWEFIQNAASVPVVGYTPVDTRDLYTALNAIYQELLGKQAFSSTALLGVSLGGLHTLYLAREQERRPTGELNFARYVAINPPVDLLHALKVLDDYYAAPLAWPAAERETRIQNTLLKAAALIEKGIDPARPLPFDRTESNFLIGLSFRLALRDAIYASQEREDLGVLEHPISHWKRQPLYAEIQSYSFYDYLKQFVEPYYLRGAGRSQYAGAPQDFLKAVNLWAVGDALKTNPEVFIFTNENDFLLRPQDFEWLKQDFGPRFSAFPDGGHLGNLYKPEVQEKVMQPLMELLARRR